MAASTDHEQAMGLMADLVTPMALRVVATLGIADLIAAGTTSTAGLAEAAGAHAGALERLLRHLASVGVLSTDESGGFALTARGECLQSSHPAGLASHLDMESAVGRAELALVHLLHSVRTGEPAYSVMYGDSFWEDLNSTPERRASFDRQMSADVAGWAAAVVEAYDWGSLHEIVDVGGGIGTMLIALLRRYPSLRGTVFELPVTAESARSQLDAAGLADRGTVVAGDFFESVPPGADGYLLSAILHDWDDPAAQVILSKSAAAAGRGGRVFVVEKTGTDGETIRTGMDLRMLTFLGGRERGVAELARLASSASLRVAAVHPAGDLAVVELATAAE